MISDEQKLEIRHFIEAYTAQWTDFVSMLDKTLGLYPKPVKTPRMSSKEIQDMVSRPPTYRGSEDG